MTFTVRVLSVFVLILTENIWGFPAHAQQSLTQKLLGTWTLSAGWDQLENGTKRSLWMTGSTSFDSKGHFTVFLIGKDRPKASGPLFSPVGPLVAYYGSYTVDESKGVVDYNIEYGSTTALDGTKGRQWTITFNGDVMRTTGKSIPTPQGTFIPINEWKRAN